MAVTDGLLTLTVVVVTKFSEMYIKETVLTSVTFTEEVVMVKVNPTVLVGEEVKNVFEKKKRVVCVVIVVVVNVWTFVVDVVTIVFV